MDFQQLRTFTVIAKVGSFTKAAEQLDYAQSSVSAQVRALETELETRLFERMGREICLTEAGQRLLVYAEQFLKLAEEAKESVSGSAKPAGTLTIGAPESLCVFLLPPVLLQYRKLYPEVKLVLKLGSCKDLYEWTRQNRVDVGFLMGAPKVMPGLLVESMRQEQMVLVGAKDHPLALQASCSPQDLAGQDLIVVEEAGCCYRIAFERQVTDAGVQWGSVQEFGSVEMIKKCVFSGLGISVLPRMTVEEELARGQLTDLKWDDSGFNTFTLMAIHKDRWLSPALTAFIQLARERIGSLGVVESPCRSDETMGCI